MNILGEEEYLLFNNAREVIRIFKNE